MPIPLSQHWPRVQRIIDRVHAEYPSGDQPSEAVLTEMKGWQLHRLVHYPDNPEDLGVVYTDAAGRYQVLWVADGNPDPMDLRNTLGTVTVTDNAELLLSAVVTGIYRLFTYPE